MLISVIIPVYNVEDYLEDSIKSIISQTIFIKELIKKILLKFSKQTYLNVLKNWQINTRQIKPHWM